MNAFVAALADRGTTTTTENGDKTFSTSQNACVDLFFQSGALRGQDKTRIIALFSAAYAENPDVATRISLWLRDVREGAGERETFRQILKYLEIYAPDHLIKLLPKVPELGRWDDLFVVMNNDKVARAVLELYRSALLDGNALAAKWAPRKGVVAARLRNFLGMTPKQYRRLIVYMTDVVETAMCAKEWESINYNHVPSVASARYTKAFGRHDNARYMAHVEAARSKQPDPATGKVAKINAGAVFPFDVLKAGVDGATADAMWAALPDFVAPEMSFLPLIDTSGSMTQPLGSAYTAMDVAVSLGMYLAERNKSAFKDLAISFETTPRLYKIPGGDVRSRERFVKNQSWAMSTNLDAAMYLIVDTAVRNHVAQADLPRTLIVLSDMEFNGGTWGGEANSSVAERTKQMFDAAGYQMPNIVWWNITSRNGSTPVRANEQGMALVSGFSPSIVQSLGSGEMTPVSIMLKAVMKDRYAV